MHRPRSLGSLRTPRSLKKASSLTPMKTMVSHLRFGQWLNINSCFYGCLAVSETYSFQYHINALGEHTDPLPLRRWKLQTHKQSLSNQVPTHSWLKRLRIQVKCPAQGHSLTQRQPRPAPETSRSKVAARNNCPTTFCPHMGYVFRYRKNPTLWCRVLGYRNTERGHCQGACRPQWFF